MVKRQDGESTPSPLCGEGRGEGTARLAVALLSSVLIAVPVSAQSKSPQDTIRIRFIRDTIYHATIDIAETTITFAYGDVPLVSCTVHPVDADEARDFLEDWNDKAGPGWRNVERHYVWSGRSGISDTVVEVIARVSEVDPVLIKRLLPDRFDVHLDDDVVLRIMTPEGASAKRRFYENWRNWTDRLNPFSGRTLLELVVTPTDAQMLYYALEPGTPVIMENSNDRK